MLSLKELQLRAALFQAIRKFFCQNQFLEVDTPIRQPVIIPESNIQPVASGEAFLQTSPELCMKRLLVAGCRRIFQICQCFRKEEMGRHHLEEFTMLEWYRSGADYHNLMRDCEELLSYIFQQLAQNIAGDVGFQSNSLILNDSFSLEKPWRRITVAEAFSAWSPRSLGDALSADLFDEILVEHIEPKLGFAGPVFLIDYPISMASLARPKEGSTDYAERFELYINGIEIANGFSELTNTLEQRLRFETEIAVISEKSGDNREMPEKFLSDLGRMHDAAGIALGIDRLFMLISGKTCIYDAVSFSPDDM